MLSLIRVVLSIFILIPFIHSESKIINLESFEIGDLCENNTLPVDIQINFIELNYIYHAQVSSINVIYTAGDFILWDNMTASVITIEVWEIGISGNGSLGAVSIDFTSLTNQTQEFPTSAGDANCNYTNPGAKLYLSESDNLPSPDVPAPHPLGPRPVPIPPTTPISTPIRPYYPPTLYPEYPDNTDDGPVSPVAIAFIAIGVYIVGLSIPSAILRYHYGPCCGSKKGDCCIGIWLWGGFVYLPFYVLFLICMLLSAEAAPSSGLKTPGKGCNLYYNCCPKEPRTLCKKR